MQYTVALLALAAVINASPLPQAVTAILRPSGSAPPGCMPTFVGSFGIAVMNVSTATAVKRAVSQISEYVESGRTKQAVLHTSRVMLTFS